MIDQLDHEVALLNDYSELLMQQHQRKKRGYINGIGSLARTLFGTLDDEFAKKCAEDIQRVQNNEAYLLDLIKNQTIIIETENQILKRNEEFMNKQLEAVDQRIKETQYQFLNIKDNLNRLTAMTEPNADGVTATLMLASLRKTQEILTNALADIHRGSLDMNLFTPKQLIQQLENIGKKKSPRLAFPIKNIEDNIKDMYKLISVKARLTRQYLLFELHIPLISLDEFTMYRNIPIPIQLPNTSQCKILKIASSLIAVNYRLNTYIHMDESVLSLCNLSNETTYLCYADLPVTSLHEMSVPCEIKILTQTVPTNCHWTTDQCVDVWYKLHKQNIWLYNCAGQCTARVLCDEDQVTVADLSAAGLIALGQNCVIQRRQTTIYSFNVFGSETQTGTEIEVPEIGNPNTVIEHPNYHGEGRLSRMSLLNLTQEHIELEQSIAVQKKNQEHLPHSEISVHDTVQYSLTTLLVGGTAITIVWRLLRKWRNCGDNTTS